MPGTEIPKWFNHQSVENSISFWVGHKVLKLAVCLAFEPTDNSYGVGVSINGCEISSDYQKGEDSNNLWLFSISRQFLQKHLNDSNPAERNHFEVTYEIHFRGSEPRNPKVIKRWGVHVECSCPPREFSIPNAIHDDDDDGCDYLEAEEYQPTHQKKRRRRISASSGP